MERRVRGNSHARCEAGEKTEITSNSYLSLSLGGAQGQATDIEIHAKRIIRIKEKMNQILAEKTGQPLERIKADTERDNFMEPEEAKAYGLIDEVIEKPL